MKVSEYLAGYTVGQLHALLADAIAKGHAERPVVLNIPVDPLYDIEGEDVDPLHECSSAILRDQRINAYLCELFDEGENHSEFIIQMDCPADGIVEAVSDCERLREALHGPIVSDVASVH